MLQVAIKQTSGSDKQLAFPRPPNTIPYIFSSIPIEVVLTAGKIGLTLYSVDDERTSNIRHKGRKKKVSKKVKRSIVNHTYCLCVFPAVWWRSRIWSLRRKHWWPRPSFQEIYGSSSCLLHATECVLFSTTSWQKIAGRIFYPETAFRLHL